ncbi:MAG: crotonase/enoyl-CoA hydratase family protein [Proteobacteria bacterium]|nr:crotonase/enoyl-CoA hydratase family protein [Pseudomonadota bacterium]
MLAEPALARLGGGATALRQVIRRSEARTTPVPAPRPWNFAELAFEELDVRYDEGTRILWQYMRPKGRPSFTLGLLREMTAVQRWLERGFASLAAGDEAPVRYSVMASRIPTIYNLGGDLPLFAHLIRQQDRDGLRAYAHACIDVQYSRAAKTHLSIVSISLVQGDALGGGFESALADDLIIAEKSAKFGLPEILFNLFPGMGAYSFLSRRIDPVRARQMIVSGRIYGAEELQAMGIVDVLAEDGRGEEAVYDYVKRGERSFNAHQAVHKLRQMSHPVSREELIAITDLWVETALNIEPGDLKKMERLASAQDRRWRALARVA